MSAPTDRAGAQAMSARRDWTHASDTLRRRHVEMAAWQPEPADRVWGAWIGLCAVVVSACVVVIGFNVVRGLFW